MVMHAISLAWCGASSRFPPPKPAGGWCPHQARLRRRPGNHREHRVQSGWLSQSPRAPSVKHMPSDADVFTALPLTGTHAPPPPSPSLALCSSPWGSSAATSLTQRGRAHSRETSISWWVQRLLKFPAGVCRAGEDRLELPVPSPETPSGLQPQSLHRDPYANRRSHGRVRQPKVANILAEGRRMVEEDVARLRWRSRDSGDAVVRAQIQGPCSDRVQEAHAARMHDAGLCENHARGHENWLHHYRNLDWLLSR